MAIEVATFGEQNELFFSDQTPPELVNRLNSIGVEPDVATKEAMFQDVLRNFPTLLDGYIAYYKFLFRTAQFAKAERIIWRTLKEAARQGGFHWNYRLLKIDTAPLAGRPWGGAPLPVQPQGARRGPPAPVQGD